jgi:hypothetical protein
LIDADVEKIIERPPVVIGQCQRGLMFAGVFAARIIEREI